MSQTLKPPDAAGSRPLPGGVVATAQFLVFDPGLFIVDMVAPHSAGSDMGLRLPAIRLDMTPSTPVLPGRAVVTGALAEGWMWRTDEPVFVLVTGGRAGMMLTIYRAGLATPAPEIRFRQITTSLTQAGEAAATLDASAMPLVVLAHIRNTGDVTGPGGRWLGVAGSHAPIEGFAITPGAGLGAEAIEYQAILGNSWNTPWFSAGAFCGSRGMLLPLLGVRVRLAGAAAEAYTCRYAGRFVGVAEEVLCADGAACAAGDAALEALQVTVVRQGTPAVDEPKPIIRPMRTTRSPMKE